MIQAIDLLQKDPKGQIFTHFDEVEGQIDIAVSLIEALCIEVPAPLHLIPILADYAKVIRKQRGLETHRLKRLTVEICDANPLLFLEFKRNDSFILADGNHRYYCLHHHGRSQARAWLVPEKIWRPYMISGLPQQTPEECLNSFSGVR